MKKLSSSPQIELPIWKGRRGMINTVLCCVLALPCAFGLWFFAESSTIVPTCSAYASSHGMTYTDFKLTGVKHASTVVCMFNQTNGTQQEIHLSELVPYLTDLWVSFAITLEITVPGFAILLALALVSWYKRTVRTGA